MGRYIPAIQEALRRAGFPIERAGKVQQVTFGPGDGFPVQVVEQQRWESRNRDETRRILVTQDSVTLQSTASASSSGWALRYIDAVRPQQGREFRFYLRPGLHGLADEVFPSGRHLRHIESRGRTAVGGESGTMVVRMVQNDRGFSLPPDLLAAAPRFSPGAKPGELATLIDMDHYVEGTFDADSDWVIARAYEMHDHIVETFHEHVVTTAAIEEWK